MPNICLGAIFSSDFRINKVTRNRYCFTYIYKIHSSYMENFYIFQQGFEFFQKACFGLKDVPCATSVKNCPNMAEI